MAYINKKELKAIDNAYHYVHGLLEGCGADENSDIVKDLKNTLRGLDSVYKKGVRG